MRDPGAVEAVARLALLVLAHLRERDRVHLRVAARRDERRHPADRVRAAPVAGADEQLGVRAHERDGHRHLRAVGEQRVLVRPELLDHREDVVPAARVERRRVRPERVEDLVHLEGGEDRLDRGPSRAPSPAGCRPSPAPARTRRSRAAPPRATRASAGRGTAPSLRSSSSAPLCQSQSPKSKSDPDTGSPSTSTCRSGRCQPRGRITSVAISSFRRYCFSPVSSSISRRTASRTLRCPSTTFVHVGEDASSKSAMKTRAPELSALIIILRSTGPVISTRRSSRPGGAGGTRQSPSRTARVSSRKSGFAPASSSAWRSRRRAGAPLSSGRARAGAAPRARARRRENGTVRRGEDLDAVGDGGRGHARAASSNCSSSVEPLSASVEACPPLTAVAIASNQPAPDLALVARRGVPVLLEGELVLLEADVGRHALVTVPPRELEHRGVERVEARQGDELVAVAHPRELLPERRDPRRRRVLAPVEARRAVVGQELAREALVHGRGELLRLVEVGRRRLAPEDVRERRVGEGARDRRRDPLLDAEEALGRPLARDERLVALVDVARQQRRRQGVGAGDEHGRDAGHVRGEAGGRERAQELARRDEHLAAEVAALLLRRELVLVVHAGGACLDHLGHQLEGVEGAAEAGLGVGDDRQPVVDVVPALGPVDPVGAEERVVQPPDELRRAVRRGTGSGRGRSGRTGSRQLRPAQPERVERLEPGLRHLHRLAAGERPSAAMYGSSCRRAPQPTRPEPGERVVDVDRAAQPHDLSAVYGRSIHPSACRRATASPAGRRAPPLRVR